MDRIKEVSLPPLVAAYPAGDRVEGLRGGVKDIMKAYAAFWPRY